MSRRRRFGVAPNRGGRSRISAGTSRRSCPTRRARSATSRRPPVRSAQASVPTSDEPALIGALRRDDDDGRDPRAFDVPAAVPRCFVAMAALACPASSHPHRVRVTDLPVHAVGGSPPEREASHGARPGSLVRKPEMTSRRRSGLRARRDRGRIGERWACDDPLPLRNISRSPATTYRAQGVHHGPYSARHNDAVEPVVMADIARRYSQVDDRLDVH